MTGFDKWFANITKEYPLYQDKDGYNVGNIPALKVGWKAALEYIRDKCCGVRDVSFYNLLDEIDKELKEK